MLRQRFRYLLCRKGQRGKRQRIELARVVLPQLLPLAQLGAGVGLLGQQRFPSCQFATPQTEAVMFLQPVG